MALALPAGLAVGVAVALPAGLLSGLVASVGRVDAAERSTSPMRSYRGARAMTLIEVLAWVPAFGLGGVLALILALGLAEWLGWGRVGLAAATVALGRSAWFAFACAALRPALHRPSRLPVP